MTLIKPSSCATEAAEFFRIDASAKLGSKNKHLLGLKRLSRSAQINGIRVSMPT